MTCDLCRSTNPNKASSTRTGRSPRVFVYTGYAVITPDLLLARKASRDVQIENELLIEDFEKVRNDPIIAIIYKRQGFSRKCRSCGSDVVRGFDDTVKILCQCRGNSRPKQKNCS